MEIAICIITYRRPARLASLLKGLSGLTFAGDKPDLRIIVVDNDPDRSAADVCRQAELAASFPLDYVVERRAGIPFARNKAIECAVKTADLAAFIDDDEVPEPNWLDELWRVQREHGADVVAGPVIPRFEGAVPSWMIKGRFFDRRRYATGHELTHAFTGNVLVSVDVYKNMGKPFDTRMATTSGEDSHFFKRVRRAGYRIVWADEALVYEWHDVAHVTARWLVLRAYRFGTLASWVALDLAPSVWTGVVLFAKGATWIGIGVLTLLGSPFGGRHVAVKGMRDVAYGVGQIAGIAGVRYHEYRRATDGKGA